MDAQVSVAVVTAYVDGNAYIRIGENSEKQKVGLEYHICVSISGNSGDLRLYFAESDFKSSRFRRKWTD